MPASLISGFIDEERSHSRSPLRVKPKARDDDSPIECDAGDDEEGEKLLHGPSMQVGQAKNGRVLKETILPEEHIPDPDGDFRHHLDGEQCKCIGDEQCQLCVTHRDLLGVPQSKFHVIDRRWGRAGEELNVSMLTSVAHQFGFL